MSKKISDPHFEQLTGLVNQQRSLRNDYTNLAIAQKNLAKQMDDVFNALAEAELGLEAFRETLVGEYGDVNISLVDGEIIVEEAEETE